MKLSPAQIEAFVAAPARQSRGVLLYGPDHGLMHLYEKKIVAAVLTGANADFNHTELGAEQLLSDPASLADALGALSLLGGQRLVMVKNVTDKHTAVIQNAASSIAEDCFLLLSAEELSPRSSLRLWAEKAAHMAALPCYKDEGKGLEQLIMQEFRRHGLHLPREGLQYLQGKLGGDRMLIMSELEKIALYFLGETEIPLESLQRLIESQQEHTIDQVCHAFMAGNSAALCAVMDALLVAGTQPVVFLRAIDRALERIEGLHLMMQGGKPFDQAAQALRPPLFFRDKPLYRAYVQRWRHRDIMRVRHQLMRLEAQTKLGHHSADTLLGEGLLKLMRLPDLKAAA